MQCIKCGHEKTMVRMSVPFTEDGHEPKVLRERRCESCSYKFRTIEKPVEPENAPIRSDKGSD